MNFSYLDRGNYTNQITRFQENFKESKFIFLDFDHFSDFDKRKNMILALFDFLNLKIEPSLLSINFIQLKNIF